MSQEKLQHGTKDYRSFGLIMGAILSLVFGVFFPYRSRGEFNLYFVYAGSAFILLGLIIPVSLKYPYIVWMKFGEIMGSIMSRIILGIVYYLVFTPVSIFRKLLGKDSMNRKLDKKISSYRMKSESKNIEHMERPF